MPEVKWEKEYQDKGFEIFSPQNVDILRAIQAKYAVDYVPFFQALAKKADPDNSTQIAELAKLAQTVVRGISRILGMGGRPATKGEIEATFSAMTQINEGIKYYSDEIVRSAPLAEAAKEIQEATGVSIEGLKNTDDLVKSKFKAMTPQKEAIQDYFQRVAPRAYETAQEFKGGLISAALGPFGQMAELAGSAVTGIVKDIHRRRVAKKEQKALAGLAPLSRGVPEAELSGYAQAQSGTQFGRGVKSDATAGLYTSQFTGPIGNVAAPETIRPAGRSEEVRPKTSGAAGRSVEVPAVMNLFDFFDKQAYKARYTRELMEIIKKGPTGGAGKGGWTALLGILSAIAVGLAAFAGFKAGEWLRKKFPQIDEFLSGKNGLFTKMFLGWDNLVADVGLGWKVMGDAVNSWWTSTKDTLGEWFGTAGDIFNKIKDKGKDIWDHTVAGAVGFYNTAKALYAGIPGLIDRLIPKEVKKATNLAGLTGFAGSVVDVITGASGLDKSVKDKIAKDNQVVNKAPIGAGGVLGAASEFTQSMASSVMDKTVVSLPGASAVRTINADVGNDEVPIVPPTVKGTEGFTEAMSAIMRSGLAGFADAVKKLQPKGGSLGMSANDEVRSLRDPITSGLAAAMVTTED